MITLTPSQLRTAAMTAIRMKEPFFIHGPVGVGKSDIIRSCATELNVPVVDVRLATIDPVDMRGFPMPDAASGVMHYYPPSFMPQEPKAKSKAKPKNQYGVEGVLFLDELTSAAPMVQAAGYELTLDRRIGEYKLPDGWAVCAAGNRVADRSLVQQTPAALNNRMMHFEVTPDLEDFVAWGRANGVHDAVLGMLRWKPRRLHAFDAAQNPHAFATPRSWAKVSRIVKEAEASSLPTEVVKNLVVGTVGVGDGTDFMTFLRTHHMLPTLDEILADPVNSKMPDGHDIGAMHALSTMLGSAARRKNFDAIIKYMSRAPIEWQSIVIRDALKVDQTVTYTAGFTTWSQANSSLVLS